MRPRPVTKVLGAGCFVNQVQRATLAEPGHAQREATPERQPIMRHTLLGTSFALGTALAAIAIGAAPAHADVGDAKLLQDLRNASFVNTDYGNRQLVTDAHTVCTVLATTSHDGEEIAQQIFVNSDLASIGMAREFVIIAVDDLCPQFDHRNDNSAAAARTERT